MPSKKPNLFQRVMTSWNETLPYNAVHSIRVVGMIDEFRLRKAISRALTRCGFSSEEHEICLQKHRSDRGIAETLRKVTESELNQRFSEDNEELPFRFFLIPDSEGEFILGLCYFHPIASADSICWLLEDIIQFYTRAPEMLPSNWNSAASFYVGAEEMQITSWSRSASPSYRNLIPRNGKFLFRWITTLQGAFEKSRKFARVSPEPTNRNGIRVKSIRLTREEKKWIRAVKAHSLATFHDILLALTFEGLKSVSHKFRRHPRRNEVSVGSIINTRQCFGQNYETDFGLYLAMFTLSQKLSQKGSFERLLSRVSNETRRIKRDRLYLRNLLLLKMALVWGRVISPERRSRIYSKHFPLSASVTNFFVDRFQRRMGSLPVTDYSRAVSASPATPLVLSVTTFKEETVLNFIYDQSIYSDENVELIADRIRGLMRRPENVGSKKSAAKLVA